MNSLYSDDDSSDDEVVVFKTSDKRQELRREIIEKNLSKPSRPNTMVRNRPRKTARSQNNQHELMDQLTNLEKLSRSSPRSSQVQRKNGLQKDEEQTKEPQPIIPRIHKYPATRKRQKTSSQTSHPNHNSYNNNPRHASTNKSPNSHINEINEEVKIPAQRIVETPKAHHVSISKTMAGFKGGLTHSQTKQQHKIELRGGHYGYLKSSKSNKYHFPDKDDDFLTPSKRPYHQPLSTPRNYPNQKRGRNTSVSVERKEVKLTYSSTPSPRTSSSLSLSKQLTQQMNKKSDLSTSQSTNKSSDYHNQGQGVKRTFTWPKNHRKPVKRNEEEIIDDFPHQSAASHSSTPSASPYVPQKRNFSTPINSIDELGNLNDISFTSSSSPYVPDNNPVRHGDPENRIPQHAPNLDATDSLKTPKKRKARNWAEGSILEHVSSNNLATEPRASVKLTRSTERARRTRGRTPHAGICSRNLQKLLKDRQGAANIFIHKMQNHQLKSIKTQPNSSALEHEQIVSEPLALSQESQISHISTFSAASTSSLNEKSSLLLRILSLTRYAHHLLACCVRVSSFQEELFKSPLSESSFSPSPNPQNTQYLLVFLRTQQFPSLQSHNSSGVYLRVYNPVEYSFIQKQPLADFSMTGRADEFLRAAVIKHKSRKNHMHDPEIMVPPDNENLEVCRTLKSKRCYVSFALLNTYCTIICSQEIGAKEERENIPEELQSDSEQMVDEDNFSLSEGPKQGKDTLLKLQPHEHPIPSSQSNRKSPSKISGSSLLPDTVSSSSGGLIRTNHMPTKLLLNSLWSGSVLEPSSAQITQERHTKATYNCIENETTVPSDYSISDRESEPEHGLSQERGIRSRLVGREDLPSFYLQDQSGAVVEVQICSDFQKWARVFLEGEGQWIELLGVRVHGHIPLLRGQHRGLSSFLAAFQHAEASSYPRSSCNRRVSMLSVWTLPASSFRFIGTDKTVSSVRFRGWKLRPIRGLVKYSYNNSGNAKHLSEYNVRVSVLATILHISNPEPVPGSVAASRIRLYLVPLIGFEFCDKKQQQFTNSFNSVCVNVRLIRHQEILLDCFKSGDTILIRDIKINHSYPGFPELILDDFSDMLYPLSSNTNVSSDSFTKDALLSLCCYELRTTEKTAILVCQPFQIPLAALARSVLPIECRGGGQTKQNDLLYHQFEALNGCDNPHVVCFMPKDQVTIVSGIYHSLLFCPTCQTKEKIFAQPNNPNEPTALSFCQTCSKVYIPKVSRELTLSLSNNKVLHFPFRVLDTLLGQDESSTLEEIVEKSRAFLLCCVGINTFQVINCPPNKK